MNYLKGFSNLLNAIKEAFKDEGTEKRNSEFDRLKDYSCGLTNEYYNSVSEYVDQMFSRDKKKSEDHRIIICAYMKEINHMCDQYKVDHVFPAAESKGALREVGKELKKYIDQLNTLDRLTHDALGKALESNDPTAFDKYMELYDSIRDNIEDYMEEDTEKADIETA